MCLQIWGPGENPSQRERDITLHSFLFTGLQTPSRVQWQSVWLWGLRHKQSRQLLRAAHSWQQPDVGLAAGAAKLRVPGAAQIQFCSTCCWVSSCSAWFANAGEACSHWSWKALRWGCFCCPILFTQISWPYLKTHLIHRQKPKVLRFPRSKTNTHPQSHEPSDTAVKCLVGKLRLLSAPNSSALINAAGLICAVRALTELQCIILPRTEHLHSTDLVEKMH